MGNGADVLRHVLAVFAVAPGGGLHQHAAFKAQIDRQPVKLEFGDVFHRWRFLGQLQLFAHPGVKSQRTRGFGVGLRADAEHGHSVAHRGKSVQRLAAHALGGRIRCAPLRVCGFQRLQFLEPLVVRRVGHLGGVEHVVLVAVVLQQAAQLRHALLGRRGFRLWR